MRLFSNQHRGAHLGGSALDALPRTAYAAHRRSAFRGGRKAEPLPSSGSLGMALRTYQSLFATLRDGSVAAALAPIPDDLLERSDNLKATAYFLDAALAGVARIDAATWALVFLVADGAQPRASEPGADWLAGTRVEFGDMRAAEIGAIVAGYVRQLGWAARAHAGAWSDVDLDEAALRAGLVRREGDRLIAPFLGAGFRIGVVTTALALAPDLPLAPRDVRSWWLEAGPAAWIGADGTEPLWDRAWRARRPVHLGRYPMERVKRADEPTTLIIRSEIQRVPKRGDFFKRAESGDLGPKFVPLRHTFPFKHPLALGMQPLIRAMVALQGTREPLHAERPLNDGRANALAIKALAHSLGADFVGICEAEPWMYYSHDDATGTKIDPYHRYAVVMLIDQGYETMSGASGDDWISASQSMRAYLRGAEIAGIMAAHVRDLGYSSRAHSNAHSEVIHPPTVLMAGLGEVSRIGDTILNPFIGPRTKSVVFTTDLPLEIDRPIDFGLQDFCTKCNKCARECPPNAIAFGPKVMFNGYEIWKPDVEKCTRYRLSNPKGSACGRCMKMCPWNTEGLAVHRALTWLSMKVPAMREPLVSLDARLQTGVRNPVKRWWFDLEVVDGIAIAPRAGTNERDLNPANAARAAVQRVAHYPPALQPPAGASTADVFPVDREAALATAAAAESPLAARERIAGAG